MSTKRQPDPKGWTCVTYLDYSLIAFAAEAVLLMLLALIVISVHSPKALTKLFPWCWRLQPPHRPFLRLGNTNGEKNYEQSSQLREVLRTL